MEPTLYRLIVEQTKDYAVFALDPEGRIRTWNLGARLIKGYAAEEIIGRHFSVFYMKDAVDRGWPDHELRVATAQGRFEDEGWRVRKDGSCFWASVVITALRDEDGRLLGFSKITRDLSERKQHEEALRQSEERFRLLVEGVVDYAIYMLDPDGIITSWNVGAERIKGYSRSEILGKHVSMFFTAADREAGKPWDELALAKRVGRAEDEGWRIRKNGERFWARVVVSALWDAEGRLRGFAKVTQDLSERRHVQALENAAQNVHEFIAVLAHELRNPLAPIRTAVHAMARLPAGSPAHETLRQAIERQAAQLARIVDDLVDISRITTGAISMERRPVDMVEAVHRAVETSAPLIQAGRQHLRVDLADSLMVHGDLLRLTQLLTNLLNNAARYTPAGGNIAVSAHAEGTFAVVKVRDTGQGIEPQMLGRIFQMFVRGVSPLEHVGGGLGIGLALARKLVELHEGSLEGHSEGVGKGSEFTVRIPLLRAADGRAGERQRAAPEIPRRAVRPQRVLVVDDNVDAATSLNVLLGLLGHETRVVYDGVEAIRMAVEFRPDVVLLDIGMPGMDGLEVARRLQALRHERSFRIVAITGWGQESDRRHSSEAGFDLHLVKPVELSDLVRAVNAPMLEPF